MGEGESESASSGRWECASPWEDSGVDGCRARDHEPPLRRFVAVRGEQAVLSLIIDTPKSCFLSIFSPIEGFTDRCMRRPAGPDAAVGRSVSIWRSSDGGSPGSAAPALRLLSKRSVCRSVVGPSPPDARITACPQPTCWASGTWTETERCRRPRASSPDLQAVASSGAAVAVDADHAPSGWEGHRHRFDG